MSDYIGGEQYKALNFQKEKNLYASYKYPAIIVAAIIVAGVGFLGGIQYQKGRSGGLKTAAGNFQGNAAQNLNGSFGGRGLRGQRPVRGTVSAVSSFSLSVQTTSGVNTTFSITADTTVIDNGQTSAVNVIHAGDNVVVIVNGANTAQASRILLNPSGPASSGQAAPTSLQ